MRLLRPAKYMDRQVATDSLDYSVVAAIAASQTSGRDFQPFAISNLAET
jgi:hypothetical protein